MSQGRGQRPGGILYRLGHAHLSTAPKRPGLLASLRSPLWPRLSFSVCVEDIGTRFARMYRSVCESKNVASTSRARTSGRRSENLRAAVSPRRAAGRHADDACGRVTASLDGGLDWTSALCPQGQSCLIGDWAILELVHGCTGDIHTCPDLPPVGSRRPDRPRSPDASLVGREPR